MSRLELIYFAFALFLAMAALQEWKRRRTMTKERVKRGLNSYVSTRITGSYPACDNAPV